jgi:UDP-glucose:(glucosyl)LPS alpha-1,2-glucosyltransferase
MADIEGDKAYTCFEENEISINSVGGTELTKRSIAAGIDPKIADHFQVVASRVRELKDDKIRVFWLHDLAEDSEVSILRTEEGRAKFHKLVFSSHWQHQQYVTKLGLPWSVDNVVIETAVKPIPAHEKPYGPINLIYFSTPNRGLEILVPVFEKLAETRDVHLDVFSSFKLYGWDRADDQYEQLFERCRAHPKITYHGFQPNEVLREALKRAHILAYPSIWEETSCRCLIESMSAGLLCVHPSYGALPDTAGGMTAMYPMEGDVNRHAATFYANLDNAVTHVLETHMQYYLRFVKGVADARFNLHKITSAWDSLLRSTLQQYPTVESRAYRKPVQMFRYST